MYEILAGIYEVLFAHEFDRGTGAFVLGSSYEALGTVCEALGTVCEAPGTRP